MNPLLAWGLTQWVLVVLAVIIIIVLIILMATKKPPQQDIGSEEETRLGSEDLDQDPDSPEEEETSI
ncbi:MAG: hypothetical protein ACOCTQ_04515 [Planctomycetota bacterium]